MSLKTEAYRASLALNNRGVEKINLRCYHEAIEAFRGAHTLLKLSIDERDARHQFSAQSMSSEFVITKVEESNNRRKIIDLLNSNGSNRNSTPAYPAFSETDDYMRVAVITDDKMISSALIDAAFFLPSVSDVCFIRIDDMNGQCEADDRVLEMDRSILLYNIGSFYFMYGMSFRNKGRYKRANEQFSRSLRSYQGSLKILSCLKESQLMDNETWLDLLCMMILQRLSYVTCTIGSVTLARMYYSLLGDHRSILTSDASILKLQKDSEYIGAAAA